MSSRGFVFFPSFVCVCVCVIVVVVFFVVVDDVTVTQFWIFKSHFYIFPFIFIWYFFVSMVLRLKVWAERLTCSPHTWRHSLVIVYSFILCALSNTRSSSSARIMWRSGWQMGIMKMSSAKKLLPLGACEPMPGIVSKEINDDEMKEDTSTDTTRLIIIIVMRFLASIHMLINYQIIKYLINGRKKTYLSNWHLLLVIPIRKECPPFAFMMMPYLWMHEIVCIFIVGQLMMVQLCWIWSAICLLGVRFPRA